MSSCSPYLNTELKGQGQRCGGNAEQGNDGQKKEEIRRENIREVLPLCGPTLLLPFKLIISVYIGKKKRKKKAISRLANQRSVKKNRALFRASSAGSWGGDLFTDEASKKPPEQNKRSARANRV